MFTQYDPIHGKIFGILDCNGKVANPKEMPDIPDKKTIEAYRLMLYSRITDLKAVSYQRQGRISTYPPNFGQEASAVGTGMLMEEHDWLVPAYRELGAWLHKGATSKDVYLFFGGHEDGARFPLAKNMLPPAVPIASQMLHAVGIAYGLKYKKEKGIVFTYVGDGGTSEGDFHEALNFSGVWKVPVIFICQNNQYAISMPVKKQTASSSIAIKSMAYGIKGIKVDGNDFFAVYAATEAAVKSIKAGEGPVLIECLTYRRGAHTTSDDPSRYRTPEEESSWESRDPIARLRSYLISKKLLEEEQDRLLQEQYAQQIDEQFLEAESQPYFLPNVFQHMYTEIPEDLKKQQVEYEKYLHWKESLDGRDEHGSSHK